MVIFHGHSSFYGNANALKGKSVEIKGKNQELPGQAGDRVGQHKSTDGIRFKGCEHHGYILQSTNQAPVMPQPPKCRSRPAGDGPDHFPEIM